MAPTAAQLAQLRKMVAEPTDATYSDALLTTYVEAYPLMDERGELPYTWDAATEPPTQEANANWIPTYDLNAAAADVWQEKAAAVGHLYDFKADGGDYSRSQMYEQYMKSCRYYRSRRATKTMRGFASPKEDGVSGYPWIANLPEED